jgi:hypothetical protein
MRPVTALEILLAIWHFVLPICQPHRLFPIVFSLSLSPLFFLPDDGASSTARNRSI